MGQLGREQRHRAAKHRQQPGRLAAAAAGHQHQHGGVRRQPVAGAEPGGVAIASAGLQHGMADEAGRQAVAGEVAWFERQQAKQRVPQSWEAFHPVLPPGPNLRRHILHPLDPERGDPAQHMQPEAGGIHRHHHVRLARRHVGHHGKQAAAQQAEAGQDFYQAHHRQVPHREQAVQTLGDHVGAAHAGEAHARLRRPQRGHQAAAKNVPAGLACDEINQRQSAATAQGGGAAG